jgi:hypothetical protein
LFSVAGWLLIGYIALTFAGVGLEGTLTLGQGPRAASAALVESSMPKIYTGGYIEFVGTLVYLVGVLLLARLLRGDGPTGEWFSSCISASAVAATAVNVAVGFAAGAAAIYDGHHGASLATVTAVNDVRNFAFFLSGGLFAVLAFAVAASVFLTRRLPRGVAYSGLLVAVVYLGAIPAARTGAVNLASLLGFGWLAAVAVTSLRQGRRAVVGAAANPVPASV